MFAALARFAVRFRWPMLAVCLTIVVVAGVAGNGVVRFLKPSGYDDPNSESFRAGQILLREFGVGDADLVPLYTTPQGTVQDEARRTAISAALDRVAQDPSVERVLSFFNTGAAPLLSRDGTRTFAVITLRGDDNEKIKALDHLRPLLVADGVSVEYGGAIPVFEAFTRTAERDLRRAELIAFPITAVLLTLVFGSAVSASLPLVLGGAAIVLAFATLRLIAGFTDVSVFALNIVTLLGLGLAIDYSLFIVNRYREELLERDMTGALVTAVNTTGRAVAFSGITLAASLVSLFLFPQVLLRSIAIGGIAVTFIAVLISITLLPALISVLGRRVDALRLPWPARQASAEHEGGGFWHRIAFGVMRHAPVVTVVVVALLLTLGSPFLRFRGSKSDERSLGRGEEARRVSDTLDRDFLPHETTPQTILLTARGGALTPDHIGALFDYARQVAAVPGVTRVDSIFSVVPNQTREAYQQLFGAPRDQLEPLLAFGVDLFARGDITRLSAVSGYAVDDPRALAQTRDLRALTPPPGTTVLVGGKTAELSDTRESILERVPRALGFVALATFIILFLVFGSLTLPVKAMVMNLLSLTASFGAIVFIFQDGRLAGQLRYETRGTIDVMLPILMFGIVFGLSMDYEVLMLSRVREEYTRTGDNTLAVARGLEKTGRLITSAAALLVVVIGAFATSRLLELKSLGVGMALAIALDASIVRALLVPAAMRLMGHWNWWAPAPLKRVWERAGLGDLEGHAATSQPRPPMLSPLTEAPVMAPVPAGPAGAGVAAPPAARTVAIRRPSRTLAYLIEVAGDAVGRAVHVDSDAVTIGRDAGNTVVLPDSVASGLHALIERGTDGRFIVYDRASTNGTYVNQRRVHDPCHLADDDLIQIGNTTFAFKVVRPRAEPVPAPVGADQVQSSVSATMVIRRQPRVLAYLIESEGPSPGAVLQLRDDLITIGRDPRNTIVLADPNVSGFHARIQVGLDGGLVIEDRGSTNGTYLNGHLVTEGYRLEEDDTIQLGKTVFLFKAVR